MNTSSGFIVRIEFLVVTLALSVGGFFSSGIAVYGESAQNNELHYPRIEKLDRSDPLFAQAVSDIDSYYRNSKSGGALPPLNIFSYSPKKDETLFTVSARCNLPYEAIALLNSLTAPEDFAEREVILIPNSPGIFVAENPRNELEKLITSWRGKRETSKRGIVIFSPENGRREFFFLRGERFHPVERSFFLQVLFRFPLPKGVISSPYGRRVSPITHTLHFHHGIDIAAQRGTEVYASWKGKVERTGTNDELGVYVVLHHPNGFRTIYGHLEKISVKRGTSVGTGSIIGSVGSSGLSTGPHLHFEIRKAGESWNPSEILR